MNSDTKKKSEGIFKNGLIWKIFFPFWVVCVFSLQYVVLDPFLASRSYFIIELVLVAGICFAITCFLAKFIEKQNEIDTRKPIVFAVFFVPLVAVPLLLNFDILFSSSLHRFLYLWNTFEAIGTSWITTILIFLSSLGLGKMILTFLRVKCLDKFETAAVSVGLGLGGLIYTMYFFALLGLAYPLVMYSIIGAVILLSFSEIKELFIGIKWKVNIRSFASDRLELFAIVLIILLVLGLFIYSLADFASGSYDTFLYLTYAKTYALNHGLVPFPYMPYWGFPQGAEMIYLLATLLGGIDAVFIVNFCFLLMSALILLLILKKTRLEKTLWLIFIYISIPIFIFFAAGYVKDDSLLLLLLSLIFLVLQKWANERDKKLTIVLAMLCGFLVVVKIIDIIFVTGIFISVLIFQKQKKLLNLRDCILVFTIGLALFSPWGLKNWIYYKQPFYPFLQGRDIYEKTIGANCISYLTETTNEDRAIMQDDFLPKQRSQIIFNLDIFWRLFTVQRGVSTNNAGPFFVILLPLAVYFVYKSKDLLVKIILFVSIIYFLFWLVVLSGQLWYLFPSVIGFLIISGFALNDCKEFFVKCLKISVCIWLVFCNWLLFASGNYDLKKEYIRGEIDYGSYLHKSAPFSYTDEYFRMWQYIDSKLNYFPHPLILSLMNQQDYYAVDPDKSYIHDPTGYLSYCLLSRGNVLEDLHKLHVSYVISDDRYQIICGFFSGRSVYSTCRAMEGMNLFLKGNAELIHQEGGTKLYAI